MKKYHNHKNKQKEGKMKKITVISSLLLLAGLAQASVIVQWGNPGGDSGIANKNSNVISLPGTFVAGAKLNPAVGPSYYPAATDRSPYFNGASSGDLQIFVANDGTTPDRIRTRKSISVGDIISAMVLWEQSSGFVTPGPVTNLTSFSIDFAGYANNSGSLNWLVQKDGNYYISSQSYAFSGSTAASATANASDLTWNAFTPFAAGVATIGAPAAITLDNVTSVGYYFTAERTSGVNWTGVDTRYFSVSGTVIPEPATLGIVTAAGFGILFIRRTFML